MVNLMSCSFCLGVALRKYFLKDWITKVKTNGTSMAYVRFI